MSTVLYVEDEPDDALLAQFAWRQMGLGRQLSIAKDAGEAMDYLAGVGSFADRQAHPFPALVLLDLKLPGRSGFEVLDWIRQDPAYKDIPVVVYSSSGADADRSTARTLGASGYYVKPAGLNATREIFGELKARWLTPNAGESTSPQPS